MTNKQRLQINRTVRYWKKLGIDVVIKCIQKEVGFDGHKLRTVHTIILNGREYTYHAFSNAFPYAAKPSY